MIDRTPISPSWERLDERLRSTQAHVERVEKRVDATVSADAYHRDRAHLDQRIERLETTLATGLSQASAALERMTTKIDDRFDKIDDRQQTSRNLAISGIVFPIVVALVVGLIASGVLTQ